MLIQVLREIWRRCVGVIQMFAWGHGLTWFSDWSDLIFSGGQREPCAPCNSLSSCSSRVTRICRDIQAYCSQMRLKHMHIFILEIDFKHYTSSCMLWDERDLLSIKLTTNTQVLLAAVSYCDWTCIRLRILLAQFMFYFISSATEEFMKCFAD